ADIPAFQAILTDGHVDVGLAFESGAFDLHIHDEAHDVEYAPDEGQYHVGPQSLEARPADAAFDFLGIGGGQSYYRLPKNQNPEMLFLGFGAEEITDGTFAGN